MGVASSEVDKFGLGEQVATTALLFDSLPAAKKCNLHVIEGKQ